jgi:hypothetical protein
MKTFIRLWALIAILFSQLNLSSKSAPWGFDVGGLYRPLKLTVDRDPDNGASPNFPLDPTSVSEKTHVYGVQLNLSRMWETFRQNDNPHWRYGVNLGLGWSPLSETISKNFGTPAVPDVPFSAEVDGNLFDLRLGGKIGWTSRPIDTEWRWGATADGGLLLTMDSLDTTVRDSFLLSNNGPAYPAGVINKSKTDFNPGAYARIEFNVGKGRHNVGIGALYDWVAGSTVGPATVERTYALYFRYTCMFGTKRR